MRHSANRIAELESKHGTWLTEELINNIENMMANYVLTAMLDSNIAKEAECLSLIYGMGDEKLKRKFLACLDIIGPTQTLNAIDNWKMEKLK